MQFFCEAVGVKQAMIANLSRFAATRFAPKRFNQWRSGFAFETLSDWSFPGAPATTTQIVLSLNSSNNRLVHFRQCSASGQPLSPLLFIN
jgi:hypothetical protein